MKFLNDELAKTLTGKRVLVRVDWNVPCQDGKITDTTRLVNTRDTLELLRTHGAKVIILAHYGRPTLAKKEFKEPKATTDLRIAEDAFSFKPLLDEIQSILGFDLGFCEDPISAEGFDQIYEMQNGDAVLCENIRFFGAEEANDTMFAIALSACADIYINEAFSCSHRAHASVEAIAHHLPSYAGIGLAREVSYLNDAFINPKRPLWVVVGGSKVSTKIDLLLNLSQKVDGLIIGGAMANTFFKAKGISVGNSLVEDDYVETARAILKAATAKIVLPCDRLAVKELSFTEKMDVISVDFDKVPETHSVFDIGEKSCALFIEKLQGASTIIWNGPVGMFEHDSFTGGSFAIAHALAEATQKGALTLAGGGDTLATLAKAGVMDQLSYCSTAGGAFLECLEGKVLPGIAALG
ncbi:MAG: phosphoglycerate kinase [Pseudomonadota bacterium]|nr:phosphoglycerate kinase [Alphaproteobacteria bacterium]MDP5370277.1 phosphoglycerate kinase [Pseudomonadota bacterium]